MDLKQRIQELCRSQHRSMNQVETDLGFGKGYISKLGKSTPNATKLKLLADYFHVSTDYLLYGIENEDSNNKYYLNEETAQVAQEIFENKELRALFDATRDADPEDLRALHSMALALKRKERGNIDDTGC